MMPVRFARKILGPLMLMAAGNPALAEAPTELPGGDSAAFRQRMMEWAPEVSDDPGGVVSTGEVMRESLPLTSPFGRRRDPFTGGYHSHSGIDIAAPYGTAILSASAGRVAFAGRSGGYGNMVELDHGGGLRTRYAHLSRILAAPGSAVGAGAVIGTAGSTGRSTGSHLHFEVRQDGQARNPLAYFGKPQRVISTEARIPAFEPYLSDFARARAVSASGGNGL